MTPPEIIEAIEAAGATVVRRDGQPRLVGEVPAAVVEAIQADREAFLEAWDEYERHRYGTVPPPGRTLRVTAPNWRPDVYRRVEAYARRQGDLVARWVFDRAAAYLEAGMEATPATKSALADLLHWQLIRHVKPEEIVEGIDEAANHWREGKVKGALND